MMIQLSAGLYMQVNSFRQGQKSEGTPGGGGGACLQRSCGRKFARQLMDISLSVTELGFDAGAKIVMTISLIVKKNCYFTMIYNTMLKWRHGDDDWK